jgi:hypothetical protein
MVPVTISKTFPRVDILMQSRACRAYFDVDTGVPSVPLTYDIDPFMKHLDLAEPILDQSGFWCFQPGDNLEILSLGVSLPLSFELINETNGKSNSLGLGYILPVSMNHDQTKQYNMFLPFANYEIALGSFLSMVYPNELFALSLDLAGMYDIMPANRPQISMLNIPSALNENRYYVSTFIKVRHTLDLQWYTTA